MIGPKTVQLLTKPSYLLEVPTSQKINVGLKFYHASVSSSFYVILDLLNSPASLVDLVQDFY